MVRLLVLVTAKLVEFLVDRSSGSAYYPWPADEHTGLDSNFKGSEDIGFYDF